jgi:hypothetical protein
MNKFLSFFIAFFALCRFSYAQDATVFAKGDKVVSANVGFINLLYTGSGWNMKVPPISLAGEYCIVDGLINGKASIGAGVDFTHAQYKYTNSMEYSYSTQILGARGGFHYQFVDNLDTYACLIIGYNIVSGESKYSVSKPIWGTCLGARYYFSNNFAVMGELGDNISLLKLGVAYKF